MPVCMNEANTGIIEAWWQQWLPEPMLIPHRQQSTSIINYEIPTINNIENNHRKNDGNDEIYAHNIDGG